MPDDIHLLLHNTGFILSTLLAWAMAALVYIKDHKPLANKLIIAAYIGGSIFTLSHVIAVNVASGELSRLILQVNVSNIFTELFAIHAILLYMGLGSSHKMSIRVLYVISIALSLFFWIFPDTFLLESAPKMYFPNYYVGGSHYWVLIAWNMLLTVFVSYHVIRTYPKLAPAEKNRTKYFVLAYLLAFAAGSQAYFLVLDVRVDPIWAVFLIPFFTIPFTYAILKYNLLDIRIIAKHAFIYAVTVACVGIFIILFNYLNNILIQRIPSFPSWVLPFISALLVVSNGIFVWRKFRQDEMLKYEFITVVTHKFRTPLTHIKWAAENLAEPGVSTEDKIQLSYIQNANTKLVELTNLLMNVSETENTAYDYQIRRNDLYSDTADILVALEASAKAKEITVKNLLVPGTYALYDNSRVKFIIQILIENAIHYTPHKGSITISSTQTETEVSLRVTDTGIGISPDELPRLFTKFYRGKDAQTTDTDGMGIGLFLSKTIISRQHGRIWAESEGEGKGSTLAIALPKSTD